MMLFMLILNVVFAGNNHFDDVSKYWMSSEQELTEKMPFGSNIRDWVGIFMSAAKHYGDLDKQYLPASGKAFELISVLIPKTEVQLRLSGVSEDSHSWISYKDAQSNEYVRFFIHPSQTKLYQEVISKYKKDPIRWIATPSSSGRTVFVRDQNKQYPTFFAKLSLETAMGGVGSRTLDKTRIERAIGNSVLIKQIERESGNSLPLSGLKWRFLRDTESVTPLLTPEASMMIRSIPEMPGVHRIPYYALISKRDTGLTWFEELHWHSAENSKLEFAWRKIVLPQLEMFSVFLFENGLSIEAHQQNGMLAFDDQYQVLGPHLRDSDALFVDANFRSKKNKINPINFAYGANKLNPSTHNLMDAYSEHIRFHLIESIFRFVLSTKDLGELLRRSDDYIVAQFNHHFEMQSSRERLHEDWEKMHENEMVNTVERSQPTDIYSSNSYIREKYLFRLRRKLNYTKSPLEKLGYCSVFF